MPSKTQMQVKTDPIRTDGQCWFHILPMGEFPGAEVEERGETVHGATIIVDDAAIDAVIKSWRTLDELQRTMGVLVDREHFSLDPSQKSDAMAWALDVRKESDGLWARWEFTPDGQELYDSKTLVSRSPVIGFAPLGDKRYRVVEIRSIAMTNAPFFKQLSPFAAARAAGNQGKDTTTMDKLKTLLGLDAAASDDDVTAAVQALIDAKAAADAATAAAEKKCREERCTAFLAANKGRITDVAKFREAYLKDPDGTEAVLKLTTPAAAKPSFSARDASTPSATQHVGSDLRAKREGVIGAYRAAHPGCMMREAVDACTLAHPDLFGAAQ